MISVSFLRRFSGGQRFQDPLFFFNFQGKGRRDQVGQTAWVFHVDDRHQGFRRDAAVKLYVFFKLFDDVADQDFSFRRSLVRLRDPGDHDPEIWSFGHVLFDLDPADPLDQDFGRTVG